MSGEQTSSGAKPSHETPAGDASTAPVPPRRSAARSRISVWQAAAGCLALVPFVAAVAFACVGSRPQPSVAVSHRPSLAFDEYFVPLGPVEASGLVQVRFGFRNTGTEPILIDKILPSCGCLQPRLARREIKPGERGEFALRVSTAGELPGSHEYSARVQYTDPEPRETQVAFQVVLPEEKVVVRPKALIFYQLDGRPTTQLLTVSDHRRERLTITGIESSSPLVSAKQTGSTDDAETGRQYEIEITVAGDVPPGRHRVLLTLKTDDPQHAKLQVPMIVDGPAARLAAADARPQLEPAGLVFGHDPQAPTEKEVVVTLPKGMQAAPTGTRTSADYVAARVSELPPAEDGRQRWSVHVSRTGPLPGARHRGLVTVTTDAPGLPTVEVPLQFLEAPGTVVPTSATREP